MNFVIVSAALLVLLSALQGALPNSANAAQPSFDCSKARSWSELEVCRDETLAGLDVTLASLYRNQKARLDGTQKEALIVDQKGWLVNRDKCKLSHSTSKCLMEIYNKRISELSSVLSVEVGSKNQPTALRPERPSTATAEVIPDAGEFNGVYPDGRNAASRQLSRSDEETKPRAADVEVSEPEAFQTEARPETREYKEGQAAYDEGDFTTALRLFQAAAEHGNAAAQRRLGEMYYNGVGVAQDKEKAFQLIRKAAEQNDVDAQLSLGGYLCQARSTEAKMWLTKAADQGSVKAKKTLGTLYLFGLTCLKTDKVEAANWYRKASDDGDAHSMTILGDMYAKGEGVKQDFVKAGELYRRAVDQGFAPAAASLAAFLNATGKKQEDWVEAGVLYLKAIDLYKKDVDKGDPSGWAAFGLGKTYDEGIGIPRDFAQAKKWYNQAAEKGYPDAKAALTRLEAAEQEEARRQQAEAMADYRRLQNAPVRERMKYVSGEYGNLAVEAAHLTLMESSFGKCETVLRVDAVNGEKAEADWPLRLHLEHNGTIKKPGWFVVSGELSPDTDPTKNDGLPIGTLTVSEALPCESEGCSSPNDLTAIIRMRHGLAQWQPN